MLNFLRAFFDNDENTLALEGERWSGEEGGTPSIKHDNYYYQTAASTSMEQLPRTQELRWLQPHENGFGQRVFDCRKIALHFNSSTRNQDVIQRFEKLKRSNGKEYDMQLPQQPVKYRFDVTYPKKNYSSHEGAVCKATTMEQKWNIYRWGNRLYFVKSWTGELKYVAVCSEDTENVTIHYIYADADLIYERDVAYIGRRLDFLIQSHLFQKNLPHPLPNYLEQDDDQTIISFSFSEYGNKGCFATFEY